METGKTIPATQLRAAVEITYHKRRLRWRTILFHAVLIFFCAVVLCPIAWIFLSSLKSIHDFYSGPFFPRKIDLGNYVWVPQRFPLFAQNLFNTLIVTIPTILLTTFLAALAGYALAHLRLAGRSLILAFFVVTLFIPTRIVELIGIFNITSKLHLLNMPVALIAPYVALNVVLSVLIMRGVFQQISSELLDAARIDGSSAWHTFRVVILPLARNGIVVVALTNFIFCWGEYVLAMTLIYDVPMQPIMVRLVNGIAGMSQIFPPQLFALYLIFMAPGILIFAFVQRWYMRGLTEGITR